MDGSLQAPSPKLSANDARGKCAGDDGAQDEERCPDEALAARGELCVEPLSIEHVLRSPRDDAFTSVEALDRDCCQVQRRT
ncbi:MAG: hypothetical protein IT378_18910 [Sandaracinaceae bacterium]|nr:hypothetical protein [Sandaracinaceae bacterium]